MEVFHERPNIIRGDLWATCGMVVFAIPPSLRERNKEIAERYNCGCKNPQRVS
jgi:hypothetical protein